MDTNYNINKLNEILNSLFKSTLNNRIEELLNSLLEGKNSDLVNQEFKEKLNNYSKKTIRLLVEKNILLSIENKSLELHKSYWDVLKSRCPGISTVILSHYFKSYINDLKEDKVYYQGRTIDELNELYNNEIKNSFDIFGDSIKNISSINLDHMENINANGRVISVKGLNDEFLMKKGGIFLDRNSKIGYGKFVNKDELIKTIDDIKNLTNQSKTIIKNNKIDISDLKIIIGSVSEILKVDKNDKITNQDAKIISVGKENIKKAGNIFLGNKGIDLPNGDYVSIEEITKAINNFLNEKEEKIISKPTKVINIKGKIKQVTAAITIGVSILSAVFSLNADKKLLNSNQIVTKIENNNFTNNNFSDLTAGIVSKNIIKSDIKDSTEEIKEEVSVKQPIIMSINETEIPIEEVKKEIPVEEIKEEIPVEETKEEIPVEEIKEEIPVEEIKEEIPVEEIKEEVSVEQPIDTSLEEGQASPEEIKEEVPTEELQLNYVEGTQFQAKAYNMYDNDQINQLAAIVGGEDNGTYEGALAVISTMCNRADINSSDPLSQAKSGAYSAYGDNWYNNHIDGEIPDYILNATIAALNGIRNTTAVSFRASNSEGTGRVEIGDSGNCNKYFDFLGDQVIISYSIQPINESNGKNM